MGGQSFPDGFTEVAVVFMAVHSIDVLTRISSKQHCPFPGFEQPRLVHLSSFSNIYRLCQNRKKEAGVHAGVCCSQEVYLEVPTSSAASGIILGIVASRSRYLPASNSITRVISIARVMKLNESSMIKN